MLKSTLVNRMPEKKVSTANQTNDEKKQVLADLQLQIDGLKKSMQESEESELTPEQLVSLADSQQEDIAGHRKKKTTLVDSIYNKSGFLHYWYIKMPSQVLSLGSLSQSQRAINDSFRALSSPICPACSNGILMHDIKEIPQDGKVLWFCSKAPTCGFNMLAPPAAGGLLMNGINDALQQNIKTLGADRWERLTETEKAELIESHLMKAVLYRNVSFIALLFCFVQAYFSIWFGLILVLMMTALGVLLSLKWGYRAWQIKTGNVYLPKSKFVWWLKNAPNFYHIGWVDEAANTKTPEETKEKADE